MKRVASLLSVLLMVTPCFVQAQTTTTTTTTVTTGQGKSEKTKSVVQQTATATGGNEWPRQVSIKLEEGNLITLRNRFGPIVVAGTGGDTLEASVSVVKQ